MGSFATTRRTIPGNRAALAIALLSMVLTLGAVTLSERAHAGRTEAPATTACGTSAGQA